MSKQAAATQAAAMQDMCDGFSSDGGSTETGGSYGGVAKDQFVDTIFADLEAVPPRRKNAKPGRLVNRTVTEYRENRPVTEDPERSAPRAYDADVPAMRATKPGRITNRRLAPEEIIDRQVPFTRLSSGSAPIRPPPGLELPFYQ
jgi:hypothetical protein